MATTVDAAFLTTTTRERDVRKTPIIAIGTKCPVTSRMPKPSAPLNSTPEWERRTYDDPVTSGVIEGNTPGESDYSDNITNRTYLKGRFIKSWKNIRITEEAQLMVNQYTVRTDPVQDNVVDKMIELHRNIEAIQLKDQDSVAPSTGSVASRTRGIPRWISNTDSQFTDSATTPAAAVRTPTGSIKINKSSDGSDTTEQDIRDILTSIASTRQEDSTDFLGVCSPNMRNAFTRFSLTDKNGSSSTNFPLRRWNQTEEQVTAKVTKYNSDFGEIDLITSFLMDSSTLFLCLDMKMVEMKAAKQPMVTPLPPDGVSQRRRLSALCVTAVLNPQAHGIVTTRSTY